MPSWDRGDEIKSNKYLVKPGAVLSSKLNPETERTWWPFMMDEKTSICSTEFMQFVPHKKEEQAFVYSLIPKQIAEIEVIDCGEILRAEFIKIALPLFQSIRNNSLRVRTLTKLRDTLLPQLISGELRIPEAEQLTEEALT
jgi:type I restriction enzyme S subunit